MQLKDEQHLGKPRAEVWSALNDPVILKRSIPGCDTFEAEGENKYKIGIVVAVGPITARFNGRLHISDIEDNVGYSLTFEGSGGTAGFGKGTANVKLNDTESGTLLNYTVEAEVGGKLAQVGSRLIDGVARRKAKEFFSTFANLIEGKLLDIELVKSNVKDDKSHSPDVSAKSGVEYINTRAPERIVNEVPRSYIAMISTLAAAVAVLGASVAVLATVVAISVGLK